MKGKKVNISDLAEFVLLYLIKNDVKINHLKLQKLLYYIQSWHLVYFDKNPLFDEKPQAWVNGPVYKTIYDTFKRKGVYDYFDLKEYKDNIDKLFIKSKDKLSLSNKQLEFLDAILKHYGLMSHEKLILLTHSDAPWNIARKGLSSFDYSNNEIEFNTMYEFYNKRLNSEKK